MTLDVPNSKVYSGHKNEPCKHKNTHKRQLIQSFDCSKYISPLFQSNIVKSRPTHTQNVLFCAHSTFCQENKGLFWYPIIDVSKKWELLTEFYLHSVFGLVIIYFGKAEFSILFKPLENVSSTHCYANFYFFKLMLIFIYKYFFWFHRSTNAIILVVPLSVACL